MVIGNTQVKARGSRIRGELLDDVRAQVLSQFRFRTGSALSRDVRYNARKAESLMDNNSFHFKVYFVLDAVSRY